MFFAGTCGPQASPHVAAGLIASPSAAELGFILNGTRGEVKGTHCPKDAGRKVEITATDITTTSADELSAANLQVGWYGYDSVVVPDECRAKFKMNDDPEMWGPIPPTDDCPVCFVPLPIDDNLTSYMECCGVIFCNACSEETERALKLTNAHRERKGMQTLGESCTFCRTKYADGDEKEMLETRINKGDVEAAWQLSSYYNKGCSAIGLPKDETKALELNHRAADMGSGKAMGFIGLCYHKGTNGVPKDLGKSRLYLQKGAKKGCVFSRYTLASLEKDLGNTELAIQHWQLLAAAGDTDSMERLWEHFYSKHLSKVELEETLRMHQAACDRMNSKERLRFSEFEEARIEGDELLTEHFKSYYEGKIDSKVLEKVVRDHLRLVRRE